MNKTTPKFQFSNLVGVIVKTWSATKMRGVHYDVYVRSWNRIEEFDEEEIKHLVYDKEIEV